MSARSVSRKWHVSPRSAVSVTAATCASRSARYARPRKVARGMRAATRATGGCGGCTRSCAPGARAEGRPRAPQARGGAGSQRLPAGECMRQRAAVDVLELSAHRHAVGDAAGTDRAACGQLTQKVRRRLALDSGVGGEDQLVHAALGEYRLELADAELLRPDAVEGREVPHEHEVAPAVAARGFDRDDIRG